MLSKNNTILYVGKATSLKQRVNSYFRGQTGKDSKTRELLSQVWDLSFTACSTVLEAALMETDEIKLWDPPYNRALKRRERQLVFYSRNFSSSSNRQDDLHFLGPFASAEVVAPLTKLDQSLRENAFVTDLFFSQLPQVLLAEGFELFCISEGIERSEIRDARSLLALGLWLYRQKLRAQKEERRTKLLELEDDGAEDEADTKKPTPQSEPPPSAASNSFTAEDVSSRFARLLRRIARQYLRAKSMTRLLHANVRYRQNNIERSLTLANGSLVHQPSAQARSEPATTMPWQQLNIDTYDRMSVLLTELTKLQTHSGSSSSQCM